MDRSPSSGLESGSPAGYPTKASMAGDRLKRRFNFKQEVTCENVASAIFIFAIVLALIISAALIYIESKLLSESYKFSSLMPEGLIPGFELAVAIAVVSTVGASISLILVLTSLMKDMVKLRYITMAFLLTCLVMDLVAGCHQSALMSTEKKETGTQMKKHMDQTAQWNDLQSNFKCCGVDNAKDWRVVPNSCCHNSNNCTEGDAFKVGCKQKLESYFDTFFTVTVILFFAATILQIVCMGTIMVMSCI